MEKKIILQIIKRLSLFALFLIGVCSIVFLLPFDKQYGYNQLLKNCDKGNWLYSRIFLNKTPIDIAFIGTSRTDSGVDDGMLEEILRQQRGDSVHVANFGFCRFGRTLDYAMFKDMLRFHRPKLIVLEVQEFERHFSHEDFPCIADAGDLIFRGVYPFYFKQAVMGIHFRLRNLLGITDEYPPYDEADRTINHNHKEHKVKDKENAKKKIELRQIKQEKITEYEKAWRNEYCKNYLRKIAALAKENGVEIKFMYMPPTCSDSPEKPAEYAFFSTIGEVWLPPFSIYNHPDYCADKDHLTQEGAEALTRWISEHLK